MAIPHHAHDPAVREAHFAGTWYPGAPAALRRDIENNLARVEPFALPGRPLALICPHSGHKFCGRVAAHAYGLVRGQPFNRVVLLGPLHRPIWGSDLAEFMAPAERAYATPLGEAPLDTDFIAALAQRAPLTFVRGDEEHSLEIELPFLQVVLGEFTLVPIMLGADIADPGVPQALADLASALAELADERTLFVASTDLSHKHNYTDVARTDRRMAELIEAYDIGALTEALVNRDVMACGATALVAVLRAAQQRGAGGARVLAYQTSGDITGDKRPGNYTVGYMAAVAYG